MPAAARVYAGAVPTGRAGFIVLLVFGVLFAATLALAPRLLPERPHVARVAGQLGVGLDVMAAGLLFAGLLPFVSWWTGNRRVIVIVLFASAALLIGSFDLNLSRLDVGRSVKPLALVLKQRLRPGDEVMTYEEYYQDLPVYLQRRITVVNWKGELEFGMSVEPATHEWMIDAATFRRRWNAPRTVYLLTSHANYKGLEADPPGPMRLLAQSARTVLLVNRSPGS